MQGRIERKTAVAAVGVSVAAVVPLPGPELA